MKASELLKYVSTAAAVVDSSSLVPIAKNLLFAGKDIKATDLNTSIVVNTPFDFGEDPVAVDTQKLVALLKALKGQEITLSLTKVKTQVKSGSGVYDIASYDGADFPPINIPKGDKTEKTFLLQRAIDLTQGAVSTDDLRPAMTGVYFDSELGYVVATNGAKLSRYKASFGESFILPQAAFGLIKNLKAEDVVYGATDNMISFHAEGVSFAVRKVEGKYPPYDKVIPETNDKQLTINKAKLVESLKRVSLFSSNETNVIALKLEEAGVKIAGEDSNFGSKASEDLEAAYEGDALTVGLNAKYLLDLLNTTGEGDIKITFSESNKPVLLYDSTNPRYLQLVMPMML